ncbi:MAG: ISNCY family transposase [Candidatus Methanofastidiosa archaeon]|nr:ISNCY family transposase [Candidatus Methanofastidiosa archaeon]
MRKRFEQQLRFGQISISEVQVNLKNRSAFTKLILALQHLFVTSEYNEKIFRVLEDKILKDKKRTGRPGMDLWIIFVLAQTRLCMNLNYDDLHHMANNDKLLRQIMGIEFDNYYSIEPIEFEYQNILDNVSLLDDETVRDLNQIVVEMGHDVFKKKEEEPLRLKTDSFVVESNVHFPTDYNLLWDSARKCIDIVGKFTKKHQKLTGWRKISYWHRKLKREMRALAQIGRKGGGNKKERLLKAATNYINTANAFLSKLENEKHNLPLSDIKDIDLQIELEYYRSMLIKHIDLVERRLIKEEKIPHHEKVFSIFEPYTEWINKGKQHPNVELGKNFQITTDQFNLAIDYKIMENEVDKSTVVSLGDRVLRRYKVASWSFDKGFFSKVNKEILSLYVDNVAIRKMGRLTKAEKEEENQAEFKKLCNKHSAVESNINELEHRGLSRCPDKGYEHFKRYLGLGVCAYNLHKIGSELLRIEREKIIRRAA